MIESSSGSSLVSVELLRGSIPNVYTLRYSLPDDDTVYCYHELYRGKSIQEVFADMVVKVCDRMKSAEHG
jgi:hypothetical protein